MRKKTNKRKKARLVYVCADLPISASLVWQRTTDILSYPSFTKFMRKALLEDEFKVGSYWTDVSTVLFFPLKFRHQIVDIREEKAVAYLIKLPLGGKVIQKFEIVPKNNETKAKISVQIDLNNRFIDTFLGSFFERRTQAMVDGTFERINLLIEKEKNEFSGEVTGNNFVGERLFVRKWYLAPAVVSLSILVSLTFIFAFNMPSEIKAAPGSIISRVNPKAMANKGVVKIKTEFDKVEVKFHQVVD